MIALIVAIFSFPVGFPLLGLLCFNSVVRQDDITQVKYYLKKIDNSLILHTLPVLPKILWLCVFMGRKACHDYLSGMERSLPFPFSENQAHSKTMETQFEI